MGKTPYTYTDSEDTEHTSSSVENVKKKRFSILKFATGNITKKKKCKRHTKSDPDEYDFRSPTRSRSDQRMKKLRGILKKNKEYESTDDDDSESSKPFKSQDKFLVGSVPRRFGAKPGRGGGVSIIIRKNVSALNRMEPQESTSNSTWRKKRLARKKSY